MMNNVMSFGEIKAFVAKKSRNYGILLSLFEHFVPIFAFVLFLLWRLNALSINWSTNFSLIDRINVIKLF